MPIAFIFVDGIGLGDAESPANPHRHPELNLLANFRPAGWLPPPEGGRPDTLPEVWRRTALPFGGRVIATDASLGLPGLPQSATGQTTILTGVNAALALGRHMYGYPSPTLKRILLEHSLFKQLRKAGHSAAFLNAFSPRFFDLGDAVWEQPLSATTWATRAGGLDFRTFDDLAAGRAVYHDIDHRSMKAARIPPREPEDAGRAFAREAATLDFALFEFFQTDKAGHSMNVETGVAVLLKLERFLIAVLETMNLEQDTLVLTSDHGNLEDSSVKTHTHNPVPTLVFGAHASSACDHLTRLEAFTPWILDTLDPS